MPALSVAKLFGFDLFGGQRESYLRNMSFVGLL